MQESVAAPQAHAAFITADAGVAKSRRGHLRRQPVGLYAKTTRLLFYTLFRVLSASLRSVQSAVA